MRKKLLLLFLFISLFGSSQDFELRITPKVKSKIIYKNGTSEVGMFWFASSVFNPRIIINDSEDYKIINSDDIEKIISNPNTDYSRTFQYLNHNYDKFVIFTELIYKDKISIYLSAKDNGTDLFYSGFDRETLREKINKLKFERDNKYNIPHKKLKDSDTIFLPNGKKMGIPIRYRYYNDLYYVTAIGNSVKYQYYIQIEDSKLLKVENNKRFVKKSKKYINCNQLLEDLEGDKIDLSNLPKFIEYYKDICKN